MSEELNEVICSAPSYEGEGIKRKETEGYEASSFAMFLRFIAIVTVIATLIAGYQVSLVEEGGMYYSREVLNGPLYAVYIIVGVLSGIGWWALSYIVDACIKYLKKG